jgi:dihydroorotate dehydrogenase (NAD+) catalytic subunit
VDLSLRIKGIEFKNPIVIASGPLGFGEEFFKYISSSFIGGFTTKTITLNPVIGNKPPRLVYVEDGLLNSIGLQNPGLDAFIINYAPHLPESCVRIISVGGEKAEDFARVTEGVDSFADMIEINLSCPNVGGQTIVSDLKSAKAVVSACRKSTKKPLIAKLSPDEDPVIQARMAVDAGADVVNIGNSIQGARFNVDSGRPFLKNVKGGLSGPAFMPVILLKVYQIKDAFPDLPVIGLGGVRKAEDIVEYAIAGASLAGIGSSAMINPDNVRIIYENLQKFMDKRGFNFREMIGIAHRGGFV